MVSVRGVPELLLRGAACYRKCAPPTREKSLLIGTLSLGYPDRHVLSDGILFSPVSLDDKLLGALDSDWQ